MLSKNKNKIAKWQWAAMALLILLFFGSCFFLFYRQMVAAERGTHFSDLLVHVSFALSDSHLDYSLLHSVIRLFDATGLLLFLLPFLFAAACSLCVYLTAVLLNYLVPQMNVSTCVFLALACNLFMSIPMPWNHTIYLGSFAGTIWHNPTYILLKPVSLLAFYSCIKISNIYLTSEKFPIRDFVIFTVAFTVSAWVKPSFVFTFAPALAIILLADLIKTKGKQFWRIFLFGCGVLPSIAVCLYQSYALFDDTNSVQFGYLVGLSALGKAHPLLSIAKSLVFPALVFIIYFRSSKHKKTQILTGLYAAVAFFQVIFLYELGSRGGDGNFLWGAYLATFILFVISVSVMCERYFMARSQPIKIGNKIIFGGLSLLFAAHVVVGLYYYIFVILRGLDPL